MSEQKNIRGKGYYSYDFEYDILFCAIKDRKYKHSLDFDDFVLDVDHRGFICGIQIFDAAKIFGVSKKDLKTVHQWEFKVSVSDSDAKVVLNLLIDKKPNLFVQQLSLESNPVVNSTVECGAGV